jgi:hypothetical protein
MIPLHKNDHFTDYHSNSTRVTRWSRNVTPNSQIGVVNAHLSAEADTRCGVAWTSEGFVLYIPISSNSTESDQASISHGTLSSRPAAQGIPSIEPSYPSPIWKNPGAVGKAIRSSGLRWSAVASTSATDALTLALGNERNFRCRNSPSPS